MQGSQCPTFLNQKIKAFRDSFQNHSLFLYSSKEKREREKDCPYFYFKKLGTAQGYIISTK